MPNPFEKIDGSPELPKISMEQLFADWKASWVAEKHGPIRIRPTVYEAMSPETQEAERPEMEAYARLVSGVAEEIVAATRAGSPDAAVEKLTSLLNHTLNGMHPDSVRLMEAILKKTAELFGVNTEPTDAE